MAKKIMWGLIYFMLVIWWCAIATYSHATNNEVAACIDDTSTCTIEIRAYALTVNALDNLVIIGEDLYGKELERL